MASVRNNEARSIANQLGFSNNPLTLIAGGYSGGIYNIGDTGIVLKVMKAQKSGFNPNTQKFGNEPYIGTNLRNTEMNLQRRMAKQWLAPSVLSSYILGSGKTYGGFAMRKLPKNTTTLAKYYKLLIKLREENNTAAKILIADTDKLVTSSIKKMHRIGIEHGDLHSDNIMVTYNPETFKIKKVWIIDYGAATYVPIGKKFTNLVQRSFPNVLNKHANTELESSIMYVKPFIGSGNKIHKLYNNPNGIYILPNEKRQPFLKIPTGPRNPFIKLPNVLPKQPETSVLLRMMKK
jgi:serine/threonine protein kinase